MSSSALVSIHDVTPETLPRVLELARLLEKEGHRPFTLLVVAGAGWTAGSLGSLRALARSGHALAGHGWTHRAPPPRSVGHWIHAVVLSRDRAEHLSRSRRELRGLVRRCRAWFDDAGLPAPNLYVPPAWALGALTPGDLRELPFRWYETLTGITDSVSGTHRWLPLVGFEADTGVRRWALRASNGINRVVAGASGRPLRIALHPGDLGLSLARDLRTLLVRAWRPVTLGGALARRREAPFGVRCSDPQRLGRRSMETCEIRPARIARCEPRT